MTQYKTLLWILLLVLLALPVLAEQDIAPKTDDKPLLKKDPVLSKPEDAGKNTEILIKTIKAIVYVVILGICALFLTKRLGPKLNKVSNKRIRVVEHVSIGVRKSLHLVEIGDQTVLLGITPDRITKLCNVTPVKSSDGEQDADPK